MGLTRKEPSNFMSSSPLGYLVGYVTEVGMAGRECVNYSVA